MNRTTDNRKRNGEEATSQCHRVGGWMWMDGNDSVGNHQRQLQKLHRRTKTTTNTNKKPTPTTVRTATAIATASPTIRQKKTHKKAPFQTKIGSFPRQWAKMLKQVRTRRALCSRQFRQINIFQPLLSFFSRFSLWALGTQHSSTSSYFPLLSLFLSLFLSLANANVCFMCMRMNRCACLVCLTAKL